MEEMSPREDVTIRLPAKGSTKHDFPNRSNKETLEIHNLLLHIGMHFDACLVSKATKLTAVRGMQPRVSIGCVSECYSEQIINLTKVPTKNG